MHPLQFSQPATYIRFSSTVEDCTRGAQYDLTEEDEEFLKTLNEKLRAQAQQASSRPTSRSASIAAENAPKLCSQAQLEFVLQAFETAARIAAPFSNTVSGDQAAPILTLEEQLAQLDDTLPEESLSAAPPLPHAHASLRALAPFIYPYWQARRSETNNDPIIPMLKVRMLEPGDTSDEHDPYVCFRRREVRMPRKTRGRDALSVDKLRKLRRELEDARNLVLMMRQRETTRREQLKTDRLLFEQRTSLRAVKRTLSEKLQEGDEELLINQKPKPPRKPVSIDPPNRSSRPGTLPKNADEAISQRRLNDAMAGVASPDLISHADWAQIRDQQQVTEIKHKIAQHATWNDNFIDMTRSPLTAPPPDDGIVGGFRAARTEYLPTPPASIASEETRGLDESGKSGLDQSARIGLSNAGQHQRDGDVVMSGAGGPSPPAEKDAVVMTRAGATPETSRNESPAELSEKLIQANERSLIQHKALPVRVRYATPDSDDAAPSSRSPSFRRRMGRGGRMWIDRRHLYQMATPEPDSEAEEDEADMASLRKDRMKFDNDSDDDADDDPNYIHKEEMDPNHWRSILLRAQYSISWPPNNAAQQQAQIERNKQARIQAAPVPISAGQGSPQTLRQQVAQAQAAAAAAK